MTHALTTNLLVWLFIAAALGITGYSVSAGTGKRFWLAAGVAGALAAIAAGVVCVFFVQTDEKRVRRAIMECAAALQAKDLDRAFQHISPNAEHIRRLAEANLGYVLEFDKIKISSFQVTEINKMSSPPRARCAFRAAANGKRSGEYSGPFTVLLDFQQVELRQEADGVWRIDDNVEFQYPKF